MTMVGLKSANPSTKGFANNDMQCTSKSHGLASMICNTDRMKIYFVSPVAIQCNAMVEEPRGWEMFRLRSTTPLQHQMGLQIIVCSAHRIKIWWVSSQLQSNVMRYSGWGAPSVGNILAWKRKPSTKSNGLANNYMQYTSDEYMSGISSVALQWLRIPAMVGLKSAVKPTPLKPYEAPLVDITGVKLPGSTSVRTG